MRTFVLAALGFATAVTCRPSWFVKRDAPKPTLGKTIVDIGQESAAEWNTFAKAVKQPAGVSVYGELYDGALHPKSADVLTLVGKSYAGYIEVGLSWKDAMTQHGYSQSNGVQLNIDIASGKFDTELKSLATYLAGFSSAQILLRPGYEVSTNLFASTPGGAQDTNAYKKAFAHVRQVVNASCKNVKYIYHPARGQAEVLYPGDDVVDFQGFSIFNNDVCLPSGGTVNCPASQRLDDNVLRDIQFATKPKWIAESSPQAPNCESDSGIIDYLTRVTEMIKKYDFQGWTYINSNWPASGWPADTWGDSRISVHPEVKQWFTKNVINNPRYVFGGTGSGATGGDGTSSGGDTSPGGDTTSVGSTSGGGSGTGGGQTYPAQPPPAPANNYPPKVGTGSGNKAMLSSGTSGLSSGTSSGPIYPQNTPTPTPAAYKKKRVPSRFYF